MPVVGVDGCKGGWFAVQLGPDQDSSCQVFRRISDLWDEWSDARLILIDIPIGLSDSTRTCDADGRRVLRHRRSSVFPIPSRAALEVSESSGPDIASEVNFQTTGKKLSEQSKGILRKIKEVDDLLQRYPDARSTIREVHPEVCFWALAGEEPMSHSKKEPSGWQQRLDLLRELDSRTDTIVERAKARFLQTGLERDDILDALVAAITAECDPSELRSLPSNPPLDETGLPMEMVFRRP